MGESTLTLNFGGLLDATYEQVFGGDGDYSRFTRVVILKARQKSDAKRCLFDRDRYCIKRCGYSCLWDMASMGSGWHV